MSRRLKVLLAIVSVTVVIAASPLARRALISWGVGLHQTSVTRELKSWGEEISQIHNRKEASHAVDLLRYVQHYYVPGEGYRGPAKTEAALETQRQTTSATIVRVLEDFTGERFGLNVSKWEAWRDSDIPDTTAPNP